jgi:hypothetical protein
MSYYIYELHAIDLKWKGRLFLWLLLRFLVEIAINSINQLPKLIILQNVQVKAQVLE